MKYTYNSSLPFSTALISLSFLKNEDGLYHMMSLTKYCSNIDFNEYFQPLQRRNRIQTSELNMLIELRKMTEEAMIEKHLRIPLD